VLDRIGASVVPTGSRLIKALLVAKIGGDDREKDRAVFITDKAVYVEDPRRKDKSKRFGLNEILFVQAGDFRAFGALSASGRRPHVDSTCGVRVHLSSAASAGRTNVQVIEALSEHPKGHCTFAGRGGERGGDKRAEKELMRASAYEIAALIAVAAKLDGCVFLSVCFFFFLSVFLFFVKILCFVLESRTWITQFYFYYSTMFILSGTASRPRRRSRGGPSLARGCGRRGSTRTAAATLPRRSRIAQDGGWGMAKVAAWEWNGAVAETAGLSGCLGSK
jgi:hypothetical protein